MTNRLLEVKTVTLAPTQYRVISNTSINVLILLGKVSERYLFITLIFAPNICGGVQWTWELKQQLFQRFQQISVN